MAKGLGFFSERHSKVKGCKVGEQDSRVLLALYLTTIGDKMQAIIMLQHPCQKFMSFNPHNNLTVKVLFLFYNY